MTPERDDHALLRHDETGRASNQAPTDRAWTSLGMTVVPDEHFPEDLLNAVKWDWHTDGRSPDASGAVPPVLHLTHGPVPARPEQRTTQTMTVMESPITLDVSGPDLWIDDTLHLCVNEHGGRITVSGAASPVAWAVAMTEAHRAQGWLPLHAALISDGHSATAVLGDSGAGKSTACLRLHALGYRILAEDRAWLTPDGHVTGLDRGLRAFEDSLKKFAPDWIAAAPTLPRDAKGKVILPLIQPGTQPLTSILVLADAPLPSPAARVGLMWNATGLPLTHAARLAAAPRVQDLIRQVPWQAVTRESLMIYMTASHPLP